MTVFFLISCIAIICFYFMEYRPKEEKREKGQQEEQKRHMEQLTRQQNSNGVRVNIREEMEHGYTLRQCSKIIDAYCQMNRNETFAMMGNIIVFVPEPHDILNFQGHKIASEESIEVIFDAYYDNWHLRGLLNGDGPFNAGDAFNGTRTYHGIPQYLADYYGVPQVLVDEKVSVTLEELKVKWSVSINPAVGLYGSYGDVEFRERFETFRDLLESRYPNLGGFIITYRLS